LREERGLRVPEKRVLRRIFWSKRDKVTMEWRKKREANALNSSPNIIRVIKSRRMRWARHIACLRERRIQGFGEETEVKSPFGRPTRRWKNTF
jgi:hypothetical protein